MGTHKQFTTPQAASSAINVSSLPPNSTSSTSSKHHLTTPTPLSPFTPKRRALRCSIQSDCNCDSDDNDDDSECDNNNSESDDEEDCEAPSKAQMEERKSKKWLSKAVALCQDLFPSIKPGSLSVQYLASGSYNIIFSISMVQDDQLIEYVLRIPEGNYEDMHSTAGIHEYLDQSTDLKVPKVIAWDDTENNSLGHSHMILTRIPGKCLDDILQDLSHDQKMLLAKQLARLYHEIESITNPVAGAIKAHRQYGNLSDKLYVEAFGSDTWENTKNPIDWHNNENGLLPLDRLRSDPPGLPVEDIMLTIFKRRLYQDKNRKAPMDHLARWHEPCQRMIEDMVDFGVFDSDDDVICLRHPDLFPRNIMVDFTPDIGITGILDWDCALFVPRFAARIAPRWLWHPELMGCNTELEIQVETEPLDPLDDSPNSMANAEVKRAFEDAVGESWVSEATGRWFPLARNLLTFGQQNLYSNSTDGNVAVWEKRWKSLSTDTVENLSMWRETWGSLPLDGREVEGDD
ncbi:hypothetical protein GGS26DRAFT_604176 [Hypomontagnella submonticulosa]|nr:hypothetical protein GGS26DRAFT_604176 [Hypomontagnella submonticulosa]